MEIEQDEVPSPARRIGHRYAPIVAQIEALEPGRSLKITCADYRETKRVRHGVVYDNKERSTGSDVVITHHREGNTLWFWIEKEKANGRDA